jgi:parvulin-like peptidyl-prolyl isomerase
VPAGGEQRYYEGALELLVNRSLLSHFLKAQGVVVPEADVDARVGEQEQRFAQNNSSLAGALGAEGISLDRFKNEIRVSLQWNKFLTEKATDAELRRFFDVNRDAFNNSQVRASHILFSIDPDASEEIKDKARQRALEVKKEIESGKIAFAAAANKYSDDPANKEQPNGGDLGFFPRKGRYLEDFSAAAFAMKDVGAVSDPVLTDFGYHLIQLTDRKEGEAVAFEQIKDDVRRLYGGELQAAVARAERKTAKIEIKPMPSDLFGPSSAAPAAAAPKDATAPKQP